MSSRPWSRVLSLFLALTAAGACGDLAKSHGDATLPPQDAAGPTDTAPQPDAAQPTPDAAIPPTDAFRLNADAVMAPVPDARLPTPDATVQPSSDAAPWPDAAMPVPDAAQPTLDAAMHIPDAARPWPDAALPTFDAAVWWPDASTPAPDAANMSLPDAFPPADAALPDAFTPADAALPDAFTFLDAALPDAAPPTPDAALPPPWETPLSETSLPPAQVNLSSETRRQWIFADMIRASEVWLYTAGAPADVAHNLANTAELDAGGWPTSFPDGGLMRMWAGYETGEHTYLYGVYVLTWEGSGRVGLESSHNDGVDEATLLDDQVHGRIVKVIRTPSKSAIVYVRSSDPANHVRNMHLWAPAFDGGGANLTRDSDLTPGHVEGSLEPAPGAPPPFWHPRFLQHLREGPANSVYRFMGWMKINQSTWDRDPLEWSDKADENAPFGSFSTIDTTYQRYPVSAYHQRLGLPYEWMIDLCNLTGQDLWIQVPHVASDDLIRRLADLIADRLDPRLRVWFEYSNEIWNGIDPYVAQQNKARTAAADHFGVAFADVTNDQIAWGSGHLQGLALKTFEDEWRARGGTDDRLINVLASFVANTRFSQRALDAAKEIDVNLPEVLAVTNYFGYGTHGDIYALHPFGAEPGNWPPDLFDRTAAVVRRNLYATAASWRASANTAHAAGVPLVAYEGGQHMLPVGLGDWNNPAHVDFMLYMYAFQRTQQIKDLYLEHYALWRASGGRTPSLFVDTGTWSFFGYWGAKEFMTQSRADSKKWDAFITWGEQEAGVRAPSEPIGSRPALPDMTSTAEVQLPYSRDVVADGGDGDVQLQVIGGALPPGLVLQRTGPGSARIVGTPTTDGVYRFVIRALDADLDPDYKAYSIMVDPQGTSTHALVVFRGQDIPATLPNNGWIGRYNPTRPTTTTTDAAGLVSRIYIPFSLDDGQALFDREGLEVPGVPNVIPPTSPLNMYGGWSLTPERPGGNGISTFTGLRDHQWSSWSGDASGGASRFDVLLLWRTDQFNALGGNGNYSFGPTSDTCLMRIDMTALIADGTNELRFVVLDGNTYYVSEAAYTAQQIGDGYFQIADFNGSDLPGHRWATFQPTPDNYAIPAQLDFAAAQFANVRAVGVAYHGRRPGWHYPFAFERFMALGERR